MVMPLAAHAAPITVTAVGIIGQIALQFFLIIIAGFFFLRGAFQKNPRTSSVVGVVLLIAGFLLYYYG